jgi:3-dehydroquinate synthase
MAPTTTIAASGYNVLLGAGMLDRVEAIVRSVAPAYRYAVITDHTVGALYGDQVSRQFGGSASIFSIPPGELHKNRDSWATLTDRLLDSGFNRDTTVIALGGGVVGDLAGFVAATFMRGVPVVQVPTTLLAMIDASIGGKTGVDTLAGKNLVGAFHPPAAVVIDPQALESLGVDQCRSGLAEAIKHGAIADEAYFEEMAVAAEQLLGREPEAWDAGVVFRLIERSVQIKVDVVTRDAREMGVRKILNFGHTIGHAIELVSEFAMSHGDAVARGMVLEAQAGERASITVPGTSDRLRDVLQRAGLPTDCPADYSIDRLLSIMRGDKKSRVGVIEYAIPTRVGVMAGSERGYGVPMDDQIVRSVLAESAARGVVA